jgi:hypothetical protein
MNRKITIGMAGVGIVALGAVAAVRAGGDSELGRVRAANQRFRSTEVAEAAGWGPVPGLDYCFENPGVGAMGYHYINTGLLDTSLDSLTPEAMVYAPGPDGQLKLGAVEYIVPADAWDAAGNTMPPELLGHHLHLNSALGVYVLHAWIFFGNPSGVFQDWNPNVSCPPS